jgi:hypothetical protein
MTSDLPGGLRPDELDGAEPGLEQLLRALTSRGTAAELAGEPGALAMFRAHVPASADGGATAATASANSANGAAGPGAGPADGLNPPTLVQPAGTGGSPPKRSSRLSRARDGFPRLRVALLAATTLVAGFAAAAYAAVLPAPVQHIAYQAFHYIGVPDTGHRHTAGGPPGAANGTLPGGGHRTAPASVPPHPAPSVAGSRPATPQSGSPVGKVQPSASASISPPGPAVLSAQAVSSVIPAGTSATINGLLTNGGSPDGGTYVRLLAHVPGVPGWLFVKRLQTSAQGAVSFTTPVLRRNTWFRLADASGSSSSIVVITVTPSVSATLRPGPEGVTDYVTVSTTAARTGDVVLLQVLQNGTWVTFRQSTLNANGKVTIAISATKRQGQELQAVLLATKVHGAATSPPLTVPPPA